MEKRRATEQLMELEDRLNTYLQNSLAAEKVALAKLAAYPQVKEQLSPIEVLRRERLRHHTQSLLLQEIKTWLQELKDGQPL